MRQTLGVIFQYEGIPSGEACLIDDARLAKAVYRPPVLRVGHHEPEARYELRHSPFLILDPGTTVAVAHRKLVRAGKLRETSGVLGSGFQRPPFDLLIGIAARSRGDLLELRAALIHDERVAGEAAGFVVKDQMEALDEQVLEHLLELLLRGMGRHGCNDAVSIAGPKIADPGRHCILVRTHAKGIV